MTPTSTMVYCMSISKSQPDSGFFYGFSDFPPSSKSTHGLLHPAAKNLSEIPLPWLKCFLVNELRIDKRPCSLRNSCLGTNHYFLKFRYSAATVIGTPSFPINCVQQSGRATLEFSWCPGTDISPCELVSMDADPVSH